MVCSNEKRQADIFFLSPKINLQKQSKRKSLENIKTENTGTMEYVKQIKITQM